MQSHSPWVNLNSRRCQPFSQQTLRNSRPGPPFCPPSPRPRLLPPTTCVEKVIFHRGTVHISPSSHPAACIYNHPRSEARERRFFPAIVWKMFSSDTRETVGSRDRVWPHGSRAERAHPTELCAWKPTTGAGPYFRRTPQAPSWGINRTGDGRLASRVEENIFFLPSFRDTLYSSFLFRGFSEGN